MKEGERKGGPAAHAPDAAGPPAGLAARQTVAWVRSEREPPAAILEIGCGSGRAAAALDEAGYRVIGVDADEEAIAAARERGVEAHCAAWPEFRPPPVDVVLFTRSLHHVHDLPGALEGARSVLGPNGTLLVEEFAHDAADEATVRWFRDRYREGRTEAAYDAEEDTLEELLEAPDPHAAWCARFGEEFHHESTMLSEMKARFRLRSFEKDPYLYRFLMHTVKDEPRHRPWIEGVLEREIEAIRRGTIRALGRRIVAVPAESGS